MGPSQQQSLLWTDPSERYLLPQGSCLLRLNKAFSGLHLDWCTALMCTWYVMLLQQQQQQQLQRFSEPPD